MMEKEKRGRPMSSDEVKVTPELRDNPDIEKLGRALITAAINIAEQKKAAETTTQNITNNKGDGVI